LVARPEKIGRANAAFNRLLGIFIGKEPAISRGVSDDHAFTSWVRDGRYGPRRSAQGDRRNHPRLRYSEVSPPPVARILSRPRVRLVNVSPGGVLLDAPFQLRPGSELVLEVSTDTAGSTRRPDNLSVPMHVLRCYVAELKDGVRYHAAGQFGLRLTSRSFRLDGLETADWHRLLRILESFS
jgi:hypothetical protein